MVSIKAEYSLTYFRGEIYNTLGKIRQQMIKASSDHQYGGYDTVFATLGANYQKCPMVIIWYPKNV